MLGWHWVGTLRGCRAPLRDVERVTRALRDVPDALGLIRIGEPIVTCPGDGSVVGIVLLSASHASVHVPATGSDCLCDLFSCTPFDAERCEQAFTAVFSPTEVESRTLER